jgi:hypothetical protein
MVIFIAEATNAPTSTNESLRAAQYPCALRDTWSARPR